MSTYVTEQEQIEQIKTWFKNHGTLLLIGIVIIAMAAFAWQRWQVSREQGRSQASMQYEQLLASMARHDEATIAKQAYALISHYPHSTYAKLANLLLARADVYQGKLDSAAGRLQDIIDTANMPALREMARIRLARVFLAQNKPEQALTLLQKEEVDKQYLAPATEAKGDALLALGKLNEARQAYHQALQLLPKFEVTWPLLQMKLDNLPSAVTQGV